MVHIITHYGMTKMTRIIVGCDKWATKMVHWLEQWPGAVVSVQVTPRAGQTNRQQPFPLGGSARC
jgi:hypothetical protein